MGLNSSGSMVKFVGRKQYLDELKDCLNKTPDDPQVLIIFGEPGIGKTALVKAMVETSNDILPSPRELKNSIRIDWKEAQRRDFNLQNSNTIMPYVVFHHLAIAIDSTNSMRHLKAYRDVIKKQYDIEKKIKKEFQKIDSDKPDIHLISQIVSSVVQLGTIISKNYTNMPVSDAEWEAFTKSIGNSMGGISLELAKKIPQILEQVRNFLSYKDYEFIRTYPELLGRSLAKDIRDHSGKRIIIAFDRYELIANKFDVWLRFLIREVGPKGIWLLCGNDLYGDSSEFIKAYRESFNEKQLHFINLVPFSRIETVRYIKQALPGHNFSKQDIDKIWKFSGGNPSLLQSIIELLLEGEDIKALSNLPRIVTSGRDLNIASNLLSYWLGKPENKDWKKYVYALALASWSEPALLARMCETNDLKADLEELARRCPFVLVKEMKLRSMINDLIWEERMDPLQRSSPEIRTLHKNAREYLLECRSKAVTKKPGISAYLVNREWQNIQKALIFHSLCYDIEIGWGEFALALLIAWRAEEKNIDSLKDLLGRVKPYFTDQISSVRYNRLPEITLEPNQALVEEVLNWAEYLATDESKSICEEWNKEFIKGKVKAEGAEEKSHIPAEDDLNDAEGYLSKGQLYYDLKQYSQARDAYLQSIKLNDKLPLGFLGLGKCYLRLAEYSLAISSFNSTLQLVKNDPEVYLGLSEAYIITKRFEEALSLLQNMPVNSAVSHDRSVLLSDAFAGKNNFNEAIECLSSLGEIEEKDIKVHVRLARLMVKTGALVQAVDEYIKVIEYDREHSLELRQELAQLYMKLKRYQEAESMFRLAYDPISPNITALLGAAEASFYQGKRIEATRRYEAALAIDPNNLSAIIGQVHVTHLLGDKQYSQSLLNRGRGLAQSFYDKAQIEALSGDYKEAIFYLHRAYDEFPDIMEEILGNKHLEELRGKGEFAQFIEDIEKPPLLEPPPSIIEIDMDILQTSKEISGERELRVRLPATPHGVKVLNTLYDHSQPKNEFRY
jgi:tetratricopeptide (TPR) repeat protein